VNCRIIVNGCLENSEKQGFRVTKPEGDRHLFMREPVPFCLSTAPWERSLDHPEISAKDNRYAEECTTTIDSMRRTTLDLV